MVMHHEGLVYKVANLPLSRTAGDGGAGEGGAAPFPRLQLVHCIHAYKQLKRDGPAISLTVKIVTTPVETDRTLQTRCSSFVILCHISFGNLQFSSCHIL